MRETFRRDPKAPGGRYVTTCPACRHHYSYRADIGNPICPRCRRTVPVAERPLLPMEEQRVRWLLAGIR